MIQSAAFRIAARGGCNSMGAIATHARLVEKSGDEGARQPATAIGDEVRVLQSVMNRFLDFIRTEKVQNDEFDLSRLVERVTTRERANHPARIETEGVSTPVHGDENLLERAIENVVRNACQAVRDGGSVRVRFGADATHGFVMVEDTGAGISDIEKALRPFESARAGGLGLETTDSALPSFVAARFIRLPWTTGCRATGCRASENPGIDAISR